MRCSLLKTPQRPLTLTSSRMARTRKKGTKTEPNDLTTSVSRSNSPAVSQTHEPSRTRDEACPACVQGDTNALSSFEKERWIRCDACKVWYHWRCVGRGDDIDSFDKWCAAMYTFLLTLKKYWTGSVKSAWKKNRPEPLLAKPQPGSLHARGHSVTMLTLTLGLVLTASGGHEFWEKRRQKETHSDGCMGPN